MTDDPEGKHTNSPDCPACAEEWANDDWRREFMGQVEGLVQQHGWMVLATGVPDETWGTVSMSYTVGLANHNLPELAVYALHSDQASNLLNTAAEIHLGLKDVGGLLPMIPALGVIDNLAVLPCPLPDTSDLKIAQHYQLGKPVRALQIVWPDEAGHWPWDPECDPYHATQPVKGLHP